MTEISDAARRAAIGHPFDGDERFMVTLSSLLAGLPTMAGEFDRNAAVKQAADDRMRSMRTDRDAEIAKAKKEVATAERERVKGILDLWEVEGREKTARHLAFATDMPVAVAREVLTGLPKAEPPKIDYAAMGIRRSQDAPGGLVTATRALVVSSPEPRNGSAGWDSVVADLNRDAEGSVAPRPTPAVRPSAR